MKAHEAQVGAASGTATAQPSKPSINIERDILLSGSIQREAERQRAQFVVGSSVDRSRAPRARPEVLMRRSHTCHES